MYYKIIILLIIKPILKLKISHIILVITASLFLSSCIRNNNLVPYVPVDLYINLYLPSYSNLNAIGGWAYVSGGSKGIIIYRQTADVFSAYDRHCTHNADNPCGSVNVDSTSTFVECTCDGSQFQLYDGLVINGPAAFSLKPYRTSYSLSSNVVHIYN